MKIKKVSAYNMIYDLFNEIGYFSDNKPHLFLDVGAYVGNWSKNYAKHKNWRSIAFEALPDNFERLYENTKEFLNIVRINKAVKDQAEDEVKFFYNPDYPGINSLKPNIDKLTENQYVSVPATTLNDELEEIPLKDPSELAFIKTDIEGCDMLAIKGLDLNKFRPVAITSESGRRSLSFGYDHHDYAKYMLNYGYTPYMIDLTSLPPYKKGEQPQEHQLIGFGKYTENYNPNWGDLIFIENKYVPIFEVIIGRYYQYVKRQRRIGRQSSKNPNKIFFYPEFDNEVELNDQLARAAWHLNADHIDKIHVPLTKSIMDSFDFKVPSYMDPNIEQLYHNLKSKIEWINVQDNENMMAAFEESHLVIEWYSNDLMDPQWKEKLDKAQSEKIFFSVDRYKEPMEAVNYCNLSLNIHPETKTLSKNNHKKWRDFIKKMGQTKKANIMASLSHKDLKKIKSEINQDMLLLYNSSILNQDIQNKNGVSVLIMDDAIVGAGCSHFSSLFRIKLQAILETNHTYLFIPLTFYSLFAKLYPTFIDRIIGIPMDGPITMNLTTAFHWQFLNPFFSYLALPLASTLADNICIAGGMGETADAYLQNWSNRLDDNNINLLESIKHCHPTFSQFNYENHHNSIMEKINHWIVQGKKQGKSFEFFNTTEIKSDLIDRTPQKQSKLKLDNGKIMNNSHPTQDPGKNEAHPNIKNRLAQAITPDKDYRIICVNPDLEDDFGHYLHFDLQMRKAVLAKGGDFISLANEKTQDHILQANPWIVPVFNHNSWLLRDAKTFNIENDFRNKLSAIVQSLNQIDSKTKNIYYIYTGGVKHIPLVLEIAKQGFSKNNTFVINLFNDHATFFENGVPAYFINEEVQYNLNIPSNMLDRLNIYLCVDSQELQWEIYRHSGKKTLVQPFFNVTHFTEEELECKEEIDVSQYADRDKNAKLKVYYPGNLQFFKGYDLLYPLIEKLESENQLQYFDFHIRSVILDNTKPELKEFAVKLQDKAHMINGILDPEEYKQNFINADVILIPYRKKIFYSRTSGVYADSIVLNKPVIATRETLAGRFTEFYKNGTTFTDGDVESFYQALMEIKENYNQYYYQSLQAKSKWLCANNVHTFVDFIKQYLNKNAISKEEEKIEKVITEMGNLVSKEVELSHKVDLEALIEQRIKELEGQFSQLIDKVKRDAFLEEIIEEKNSVILQKEGQIIDKNKVLSQRNEQIKQKNNTIQDLIKQIQLKEAEIISIRSSKAWKIGHLFSKTANKLFGWMR